MNCSVGDLLIGNTMNVNLISLKVDGVFVADATCTFTILDATNTPVPGADEIGMPPTETPGSYRGQAASDLPLVENAAYTVRVIATKDGVGVGRWDAKRIAKLRDAQNCGC